MREDLSRLLRMWRPNRKWLIISVALTIGGAIGTLMIPALSQTLIDEGISNNDLPMVIRYGEYMLLLTLAAAGCQVAEVVFTRTDNPRACDPAELQERWRRLWREGRAVATSAEALAVAAEAAGPKGLVVVCGSLYLVGEVKRLSAGGARRE